MPRTILAFDFGLRRIGVAVGQDVTSSASPLGIVDNIDGAVDLSRIERLITEWQPTELLVGMPFNSDGSPGALQPAVEAFIQSLERFGLPVATTDERYSSREAESVLKRARTAGRRGRIGKADIDAAAAVLIAERYLAGAS